MSSYNQKNGPRKLSYPPSGGQYLTQNENETYNEEMSWKTSLNIKRLNFKEKTAFALFVILFSSIISAEENDATPPSETSSPRSTLSPMGHTLEDLKILLEQRDYRQFLDHAHDIRPAKRGEQWPRMVQEMASGYLQFLTERNHFTLQDFRYFKKLSRWPVLRDNEFFHLRWQRYSIRYAQSCIEKAANKQELAKCHQALRQMWHHTQQNSDLGLQVAALLASTLGPYQLWPFYQLSASDEITAYYHCQMPEVKNSAFHFLHHSITEHNLAGEQLSDFIDQHIHPDCWSHLKLDMQRFVRLYSSNAISAYQILRSKNELSPRDEDVFLIRFYLTSAKKGALLNRAWSRIEALSQDAFHREQVLEQLLTVDPLAGDIFQKAARGNERYKILISHLAKNFPEYLDGYARTCLDYREGIRSFARGNPTLACDELFALHKSKNQRWINQGLEIRYSSPIRD